METDNPKATQKRFWDTLAKYVLNYGVRFLAGDFNMSLLCVVAEMRARGFQITLAAWHPFYMERQEEMFVDSCGLFVIGPWEGIRLRYDCSVLNIDTEERTGPNSMVMQIQRDDDGKEINRRREPVQNYDIERHRVRGCPLKQYMPIEEKLKHEFIRWTFACDEHEHSAVAEQQRFARNQPSLYPEGDFSFLGGVMALARHANMHSNIIRFE